MTITYADKIGIVAVEVNEYGISFANGKAYFSDSENVDHCVSVLDLIEIIND